MSNEQLLYWTWTLNNASCEHYNRYRLQRLDQDFIIGVFLASFTDSSKVIDVVDHNLLANRLKYECKKDEYVSTNKVGDWLSLG